MNRKVIFLPIAIFIAIIGILIKTTDFSYDPNKIQITGNIEVTEVDVSFKIPGRVKERVISEGELIERDQTVAVMDSEELQLEVALRKAEVEASKAALLELVRGYLPEEIAKAQAKLTQARANFSHQELEYQRQQQLHEKGVISTREFDRSTSGYEVAKARFTEAKENLALLQRGIREEKIQQATAKLKVSKEALNLAKTRLGYATLTAPMAGFVLSENIEAGEIVAPGTPIITVGNLDQVWLRAYIDESDLGRVKIGQNVEIETDSYPGKKYEGVITFISPQAEFTPKNVQTKEERVKLVYRIKVELPNLEHELKPGMPVDGEILL